MDNPPQSLSIRIPVNDLSRQDPTTREEVLAAVERVLASGWFVLGPECAGFERDFADYCGVGYCVGVGNGTDALEIALRALDIGSGDRVATVANAGFYAATAMAQVGATPVYIDVEPDSHLMDRRLLLDLIQGREVEAIIVTHLFGRMHDVADICAKADKAGIAVIEDCAQAHGARRDGRRAGSVGDIGCFSFYPTKNLGAAGDAGALTTNDPALAGRIAMLRQYGWQTKYDVVLGHSRNSRLDEVQAAVLCAKLPALDRLNARRREIARSYSTGIRNDRVICPTFAGEEYVGHLYVIDCQQRDSLRDHLRRSGIATEVHYPIPDHQQACTRGQERRRLPVTEAKASSVLTLPCFPELTDEEVGDTVAAVNAWTA